MKKIMNKKIFIINGSGGVGKDTFVKLVNDYVPSENIDSVKLIKDVAIILGWDGLKTEQARNMLSDLKSLSTNYLNTSFNYCINQIKNFINNKNFQFAFVHIREIDEIEKLKKYIQKEFNLICKTILITNCNKNTIVSNTSDLNVYNYNYDYKFKNDKTIDELKKIVIKFINEEVS